jgi:hypothetical protein
MNRAQNMPVLAPRNPGCKVAGLPDRPELGLHWKPWVCSASMPDGPVAQKPFYSDSRVLGNQGSIASIRRVRSRFDAVPCRAAIFSTIMRLEKSTVRCPRQC